VKQHEADQLAAQWERRVLRFGYVLWLGMLPVLGVILYVVFSAGYHPVPHSTPPVFSCASENAALAPLGAGGQIAPMCGDTPYPAVSPAGGG